MHQIIHDGLRNANGPVSGPSEATIRLARLLDAEIARYQSPRRVSWRSSAPCFPPELEAKYEEDTGEVRVRDLRFMMAFGTVLYYLTALTDPIFVPDLGFDGVLLRTIPLPFMLFAIIVATQLAGPVREIYAAMTTVLIVSALAIIPAISEAPLPPFAFTSAMLALIYANTTLVLRFRKACAFTIVSCAVIVVLAVSRDGANNALGWAIALQAIIAAAFSLVANFRIEWSARLSYLLGTREAMRLQAVSADRELLKTLSSTDELTGLANRSALKRWCANALAAPANSGRPAALLMIDVDHFKRYNDYYGHIAGDECLRTIAQRIRLMVRSENDIVARYGGEEFVVPLLNVRPEQAWALAERICVAVSDLRLPHANREDGLAHVTISVGVAATAIGSSSTLEGLMRAADRGLYEAKRKGRNRVETALPNAA